jgi:hypothetical protein
MHMFNSSITLHAAASLVAISLAHVALGQVIIDEGPDFPNGTSFTPPFGRLLGQLSLGQTTVRGGLNGFAINGDTNPASPNNIDGQDSFLIDIPQGLQLSSISIATRNQQLGNLNALNASLAVARQGQPPDLFESGSLPWAQTFTFTSALPPQRYAVSVFGQFTPGANGNYSFDYDVTVTVIPTPGTLPLLAGVSVLASRRARRRG